MRIESAIQQDLVQNRCKTIIKENRNQPVDFVARLLISSLNQLLSYVIHERQYSGRNQCWGPVYGSLQTFGLMIRAAASISLLVTFCWPHRLGETIKQAIRLNSFAEKKRIINIIFFRNKELTQPKANCSFAICRNIGDKQVSISGVGLCITRCTQKANNPTCMYSSAA